MSNPNRLAHAAGVPLPRRWTAWLGVAGLLLVTGLSSCFEIDRRTVTPTTLPVDLFGEWRGEWVSQLQPDSGSLVLSVQDFQGLPVLSAEIQHPCLVAAVFGFRQDGLRWELSLDGQVVFVGLIDPGQRTITGTYSCSADQGEWHATWHAPLPVIPDLSGDWTGLFESLQPAGSGALSMDLIQEWVEGRLELGGSLTLDPDSNHPSMSQPVVLPVTAGEVRWTGPEFQLLVQAGESLPWVTLQGSGTLGSLGVQQGLLMVENAQLPFPFGLWSADPGPR